MLNISIKKEFHLTGHQAAIYALAKADSNNLIYTGSSDKLVARWNIEEQKADNFAIKMLEAIYALHHIKESNLMLVGTATGNLHVVDLSKKIELKNLLLHKAPIYQLVVANNNLFIITSSADGEICCLNATTFEIISRIKFDNKKVRSITYLSLENVILAACADGMIKVLECPSLKLLNEFFAHNLSANIVVKHPNKNLILTGGRDAHFNIFEWPSGKNIAKIPAHNYAIYDIVFSPNNNLIATASRDKTIKIWDANTFDFLYRIDKEKNEGHINSVNKLLWSSYNNTLISAGDDRALMGWTVAINE